MTRFTDSGDPTQAQRSGLRGERRRSGVSELSRLRGSEGYIACGDEMQQIPVKMREATGPPAFFTGNPCCACPYGRGAPCVGICYQKLLKGSGSHALSDR